MSEIDVSQLSQESLAASAFPASRAADFRVYFANDVHAAIQSHAGEDTSIEICGVLVGEWQKDDDGPFAVIRNFIRCDNAASKNAEVTFTHESWAQINAEMDSKYGEQRIIGWYHSHPDFGIFLSDRDMFIQEHFFCGPGQIAYVVDPVRKLEGVFEWRSGKADVMNYYWVGDRIVTSAASQSPERSRSSMAAHGSLPVGVAYDAQASSAAYGPRENSVLPSTTVMLAWLCVFLLGYLLNDLKSNWEHRYVSEGVVAHYGLWNILQIGRAELVEDSRQRVELAFDAVSELSSEHAGLLEGEERKKTRDRWQKVRKQLAEARDTLQTIESKYSVPEEQRDLLAKVVVDRLMSLTMSDARRPLLPLPIPDAMVEQMQPPSQDEVKSNNKAGSDKSPGSAGAAGTGIPESQPEPSSARGTTPATKPSLGPAPPPGTK